MKNKKNKIILSWLMTILLAFSNFFGIGKLSFVKAEQVFIINEGFDAGATAPSGWIFSSGISFYDTKGNYGEKTPSLKLSTTGHQVTSKPFELTSQAKLSFWIKGNGTDPNSHLLVEKTTDNSNWISIEDIKPLPTTGITKEYVLESNVKRVRFTYTKGLGNVALDDVKVWQETTAQDTVKPSIVHSSVTKANLNADLTIAAAITDDVIVKTAKVYYRTVGDSTYKSVDMTKVNDNYVGIIPKSDLTSKGIEYYIEASDGVNIATNPENINNPYAVTIVNEDTTAPVITKLTPADGEVIDINSNIQSIKAEYNDGSGVGVDASKVKLILDDVDVTANSEVKTDSILYTSSTPFAKGKHTATLEVSDLSGNKTNKAWTFTVGDNGGSTNPVAYNLYFGQLHSHTNLSDGTGTPDEAYTYARDVAKVDYVAITDHSNWFDNDTANENIKAVSDSTSTKWKNLRNTADKYNKDGEFVAIGAFEMTWSGSTGGWGHINTFNTPWFASRTNSKMDLKAYYDKLALPENNGSVSQLNHPGKTFGDFADFGFYRQDVDNVVDLVEVGNGEGLVRSSGYFPSYEYYTRALDKGWHLAPTNNQDNHKGKWGNANTARTVVLSEKLTRDSLYDAMRNRRVYSTEDENLRINFTVNNLPMGTILSNSTQLNAKINITDPDSADKIAKVSIIGDGGAVLATKNFDSNTAEWNLSLPEGYKYYYVRVDEADKDIAVTSPVWAGNVVLAGISKVEVSQDPQVVNTPVDISATVYNNSSTPLSNVVVDFYQNEINDANKIGTANIPSVNASSTQIAKITWTPTVTGENKIYARTSIVIDGKNNEFTQSTTFLVSKPDDLVKVVIDGGHQNQYVSGDYPGKMLTLTSMLRDKKIMLVQNNDELTASDLENARVLILTDPQSKSKAPLTPQKYSETELKAIKDFIAAGGNLIITSRADYDDKGVTERIYQSSVQGNSVLEAIGSNLRFNDDEVIDNTSNGGQNFRLYFNNYVGSKYHLTDNLVAGETYSAYSGCSVILKDGGDESKVDWLVNGHDTTETLDSDLQNDAVAVPKGKVHSIAAEVLDNGSRIVVAGTTFFSDFETAAVDNAYSNKDITDNIINWMTAPKPAVLKSIAEVRVDANNDGIPDNMGKRFAIEGIVTAQSEAVTPKNSFFEVIYLQDLTGGITVFGVSKTPLMLGQKVKVTGVVDQYGGDTEIQIDKEDNNVEITDSAITLVDSKLISTGDSMKEQSEGWLTQVKGKVTRIVGQNIYLDDGTGEARAYVEGYIGDGSGDDSLRGKWDPSIKVGNIITVVGLASEDPDGHRLRVRNTKEIVKIPDATPPVITLDGIVNGGLYNTDVSPVISVDKGTYTMTLNDKPYNGEKITDNGAYILEISATDDSGNVSKLSVNFIIDKIAPIIIITGVETDGLYNKAVTPIIEVDDKEAITTITLNGEVYDGKEISNEGKYTINVKSVDKAGNTSERSINFIIDKTAPLVTVSGIDDGGLYNKAITPIINVDDKDAAVTVMLNDVIYDGKPINKDGKYILKVSAADKAGNIAETVYSFTIDMTAPIITITGVAKDGCYNNPVTPKVNVDDKEAAVTITLNDQPYDGKTIDKTGSYILKVIAVDKAGNKSETTINFTTNIQFPIITVMGIEKDGQYNKVVKPIVIVDDKTAINSITLNGKIYDGKPINKEGSYELKVKSVNLYGNTSEISINFTIDNTAPVIDVIGIEKGGQYNSSVTPIINIDDKNATVIMTLNDEVYDGSAISKEGHYTLIISATDKAGNTSRQLIPFNIKAKHTNNSNKLFM